MFHALRAGCRWKALDATGICSGRIAHPRFQERVAAGMSLELWRVELGRGRQLKGQNWIWLSREVRSLAILVIPLTNRSSRHP